MQCLNLCGSSLVGILKSCGHVQDKVLAQIEKAPKAKAAPKPAAAKPGAKGAKAAKAEVEEEAVDPVQEALSKYGIIMSNPWDKKQK